MVRTRVTKPSAKESAYRVPLRKAAPSKTPEEIQLEAMEGLLEVHISALDAQLAEQPRLVWYWNRRFGRSITDVERCEAELKIVQGELDLQIRADPTSFGLEKVTEPGVKVAILRQPRYQEAVKAIFEAKDRMYDLKSICDALDHRRSALTHFVRLHETNYFGDISSKTVSVTEPNWQTRQRRKSTGENG